MMLSKVVMGLLTASLAAAHMEMSWPYPLRSRFDTQVPEEDIDYSMTSPLNSDGSNFPCKGYQTNTPWRATAQYTAGQTYNMTITGSATHGGGSCQLSLSYDNGKTFKVIQSMEGGCPLVSKYNFKIPGDVANGQALFAWTWYNLIGNRELYMNCADVVISGGTGTPSSFESAYPDLFVANVGNGCSTVEGRETVFANPDFDGTIFMQDSGHILFDNLGCGTKRRQMLDEQIKTGERSFRDVSEEMWGSLRVPFEDGFEVMEKELEIDPGFQEFHEFCIANGIDFNVISAGLKPILRRVLETFLGEQTSSIQIVANDADIKSDGSEWKPIWRHDTELGHDKALSVQEGRAEAAKYCIDGQIPLIVFIGDGVSDLPAAREADVLFARKGLRLEEYCKENDISYIPFETFTDIKQNMELIMKEDQETTQGQGTPARFNPRANMWRRISSQQSVPQFIAATPSKEEKMFLWPENFTEYRPRGIPEDVHA
ncbi:hypothetical protein KXW28_004200 [Aspergillus fumigatus]|nr:hypothetical protein KXX63_001283 [Aspergillus fumigatus]KAH1477930.1 hypothetical protein KXX26_001507 [Aspergillus fumigatus]KAH1719701.1 hypothetical protein KXX60_000530 [Aspergillus fumigatus]KAH2325372.1 hypothetical protein KXV29_000516 [Aspergillus fumigatus]KAH2340717.1 hypothetical protein KXW30_001958 [Aspergillus fumigatus]